MTMKTKTINSTNAMKAILLLFAVIAMMMTGSGCQSANNSSTSALPDNGVTPVGPAGDGPHDQH
jgi:hypothetical protein